MLSPFISLCRSSSSISTSYFLVTVLRLKTSLKLLGRSNENPIPTARSTKGPARKPRSRAFLHDLVLRRLSHGTGEHCIDRRACRILYFSTNTKSRHIGTTVQTMHHLPLLPWFPISQTWIRYCIPNTTVSSVPVPPPGHISKSESIPIYPRTTHSTQS
jgi:hypothetical protein